MTFWAHRLMNFKKEKAHLQKEIIIKEKNHDKLFVDQSWLFGLMPQRMFNLSLNKVSKKI